MLAGRFGQQLLKPCSEVAMPAELISVTLSRPEVAQVPRIAPSWRPGLSATGTQAAQAWAIRSARSSSSKTSTPAAAPGIIPKSESAE
jgi:hypothetical protein